jgi:hypothetical protein
MMYAENRPELTWLTDKIKPMLTSDLMYTYILVLRF